MKQNYYLTLCSILAGISSSAAAMSDFIESVKTFPGNHLYHTNVRLDDTEKYLEIIKYNESLYNTAYNTYIQANLKKAYMVAIAAVAQNPDSLLWRKRLIQVAIWTNEPYTAMDQYVYLAEVIKDKDEIINGIKLAKSLRDDVHLARLLKAVIVNGLATENTWEEYIQTLMLIGNFAQAIEDLNANKETIPKFLYLSFLSKIYKLIDEPDRQLSVLKQMSQTLGITPEISSEMAAIYLNQGDMKNATSIITQGITAKRLSRIKNEAFLKDYILITRLNNSDKKQDALMAYLQLAKTIKPDLDVYSKIIELSVKNNPELAYGYALRARKIFPDKLYLTLYALEALMQLDDPNRMKDFPGIIASTPYAQRAILRKTSTYWRAKILYIATFNNKYETMNVYMESIEALPQDDGVKADFLNYLVERNEEEILRRALSLWQSGEPEKPALWFSYASAFSKLGNRFSKELVLSQFYDIFPMYQNNPEWLMLFKDTLENADDDQGARNINKYSWPIYLQYLQNKQSAPSYTDILNYVKLSLQEADGDSTAAALSQLQARPNKDVELLMLTWALKQDNIGLAKAIYWNYFYRGIKPPAWATLSIALARNDRPMMYRVLTSKEYIANYRDHVSAAIEINAIPKAQQAAFKELSRHPKDSDLYDNYFTPVMLKTASSFFVSQEYYQYANVVGPKNMAEFTWFATPGISLTPYNSIWFTHNLPSNTVAPITDNTINANNQVLATVPSHDERFGVRASTLQRRGSLDFDIGYRDNLTRFFTGKITRNYIAYSDLNLTGELGLHQQSDDTAGMLVGGMKNYASLDFYHQIFKQDVLSGTWKQSAFYTQDFQYLADGFQALLHWDHKLWISYPDYTLSPYVSWTEYYNKTRQLLRGSILTLVPDNVVPDVNFLIPANNYEFGLTFSFGQTYIDDYTHRWRPLGLYTISRNSVVGIGHLFNVGLAGSVFGRDHLLLYYERGTNQGQGIQNMQNLKASYRIYI